MAAGLLTLRAGRFLLADDAGQFRRDLCCGEIAEVAAIGRELDTALIARQDGRRKAVVSCNVADGENLGDLVAQVRREVDPLLAGMGLAAHYGGQFEAQQEAGRTIAVIGAAVALAVAALLAASLGSWPAALVVMLMQKWFVKGLVDTEK